MTSFWLKYEGTHGSEKGLKPFKSLVSCPCLQLPHRNFPNVCQHFPNKHKNSPSKKITACRTDTASHLQCPFFPSSLGTGPESWPLVGIGLSAFLAAKCGQAFSFCQQDLRTKSDEEFSGSVVPPVWGLECPQTGCTSGRHPGQEVLGFLWG